MQKVAKNWLGSNPTMYYTHVIETNEHTKGNDKTMTTTRIAEILNPAGYIAKVESNTRVRVSLATRKVYASNVAYENPIFNCSQDGKTIIISTRPYTAR